MRNSALFNFLFHFLFWRKLDFTCQALGDKMSLQLHKRERHNFEGKANKRKRWGKWRVKYLFVQENLVEFVDLGEEGMGEKRKGKIVAGAPDDGINGMLARGSDKRVRKKTEERADLVKVGGDGLAVGHEIPTMTLIGARGDVTARGERGDLQGDVSATGSTANDEDVLAFERKSVFVALAVELQALEARGARDRGEEGLVVVAVAHEDTLEDEALFGALVCGVHSVLVVAGSDSVHHGVQLNGVMEAKVEGKVLEVGQNLAVRHIHRGGGGEEGKAPISHHARWQVGPEALVHGRLLAVHPLPS